VGITTAPLVVGLGLRMGVSWRWHYALVALYLLLVGVMVLRMHIPHTRLNEREPALPLRWLLTSRTVWLSLPALLIYGGVEACIFSWSALYLVRMRSATPAAASLAVSTFGITLLVGRFVCGYVAERIGYKRLVVGGGILGTLAIALMITAPGNVLPWLGLGLAGLALAGIFATIVADATRKVAGHAGAMAGLVCSASGLGKIILPWFVGQIAQVSDLSAGLWVVAAFSALLGIIYALT
jgi:fucose permease